MSRPTTSGRPAAAPPVRVCPGPDHSTARTASGNVSTADAHANKDLS
ncbi:hypothetical protein [Streptomyces sp. SLBN-118]|nr:hypothetical protein [Streptomyces sp. SLBN-118]